jgi:uncharacterized protein (DUF4415 family)
MTRANKRADPISDEIEAAIQRKIASDPENPEWTDEEIRRARPFHEVLPELATSIDRAIVARGRPPAEKTKMPVTIRLDPEVVNFYKSTGKGWQSRMNDALRKAAGV